MNPEPFAPDNYRITTHITWSVPQPEGRPMNTGTTIPLARSRICCRDPRRPNSGRHLNTRTSSMITGVIGTATLESFASCFSLQRLLRAGNNG
jgi:hypothetical protein